MLKLTINHTLKRIGGIVTTASLIVAAALPLISFGADRPSLTVALQRVPKNISPGRDTSDTAVPISYNVFDKLIEQDFHNGMEIIPGLAKSWEIVDYNEITFHLREGVKFHNGELMTAEDVAFSFSKERRESDGPRRLSQFFSNVEKTEIIDPLTVKISMKGVDPLIEQRFAMWSGEIVNKKAYLAAESYDDWALNPIGTGPFKVKSIKTNIISLDAFDDHYRGTPNIESLKFVEVPEVAARVAGLASGDFDVIASVPPDQISTLGRFDDMKVVGQPGAKVRILIFNQGKFAAPIMKNVHFRRALGYAIDREAIVQSLYSGRTSIPNGLQVPSFGETYAPNYPKPIFDLDLAREELKKSGYKGETIDYPLLANVLDSEVAIAEVLSAMWKRAGINVEIKIKENWKQITKGQHSIRNMSATMMWQDPATIIWRIFTPKVIKGRGWNWNNETFVANGAILANEPDKAKRKEAFIKMQHVWEHEDPIGTILFQELWMYGSKKDLKWKPYVLPYMDFGPSNL
ncbi:hypothetical protein A9Q77_04025 [Marinomonas sp. 42_23_T18]|nr:hypothetical protein A9Q77_04025 [Marinomonas sp. 42_23_T18]